MKNPRIFAAQRAAARLYRSLAVAACAVLAVAPAAWAQSFPSVWTTWLSNLQAQGYTVVQGSAGPFTAAACQQSFYGVFKSCLGTSYANPYLMVAPPQGSEYVDPLFQTAGVGTTPAGVPTDQIYQLAPTEALVVIVNLPPQAAYFSYQSYLFTRAISNCTQGCQRKSPDPARALLFASVNNSINDVQIQRLTGSGFGPNTVAIVTTTNSALAQSLSANLVSSGGNASALLTEALGSNIIPGDTVSSDQFMTVMRYAIPEDPIAGASWVNASAQNIGVYRIVQPASQTVQPFGPVTLANKSYHASESAHAATLAQLSAILKNWLAGQQGTASVLPAVSAEKVSPSGVLTGGLEGPFCIAKGQDCSGDEQDTDAYKIAQIGVLQPSAAVIMDGVDHTVDNNATYISSSVQDVSIGVRLADQTQTNPAAAGFTSGTMTGSAATVLQDLGLTSQASPALLADLPNLWVSFFARGCTSSQPWCGRPYTSIIPAYGSPTDAIEMVERAYVLPGFLNGANPRDLLSPQVIH